METASLARQFGLTAFTVIENTEGITHEESLVASPSGGNSMNWVLGHILASRNRFFPMLGLEPFWSEERASRYGRGSDPITADDAAPFEEMVAAFGRSQEALQGGLEDATEARLAAALEQEHPILGKTIGSALVSLAFHEAYHAGQLGVLRRFTGKPGKIQ